MEWHDLLADGYERALESLENVLNGLTEDDLNWQPRYDCNSIGWLAWHLTRQQDAQISALMGEEQLWIKVGWHSRFSRPADPKDTGFGHTPEQVAAFKSPDVQTLLDYHRAVLERSTNYFPTLAKNDLGRQLDEPWFQPLPTVGVRLVSIMDDAVLHAGQAAYARGLLQGKGWQKY
ncbi:MAG: DinB family protein [Desulfobacteraceae bacterium]|nr:MAG: DinB family protein [Desulfobacteraceae bacterium]